jgi:hypothetical protein
MTGLSALLPTCLTKVNAGLSHRARIQHRTRECPRADALPAQDFAHD